MQVMKSFWRIFSLLPRWGGTFLTLALAAMPTLADGDIKGIATKPLTPEQQDRVDSAIQAMPPSVQGVMTTVTVVSVATAGTGIQDKDTIGINFNRLTQTQLILTLIHEAWHCEGAQGSASGTDPATDPTKNHPPTAALCNHAQMYADEMEILCEMSLLGDPPIMCWEFGPSSAGYDKYMTHCPNPGGVSEPPDPSADCDCVEGI
jgi:hypothetical protein